MPAPKGFVELHHIDGGGEFLVAVSDIQFVQSGQYSNRGTTVLTSPNRSYSVCESYDRVKQLINESDRKE